MGTTQYYFNPQLKMTLDKKLMQFMNLVNHDPPFQLRLANNAAIGEEDEKKLLDEIKKIDENDVQRFLYGMFPDHVDSLPQDITNTLPKVIDEYPFIN